MALFPKRYSSFGREDKLVGVRALIKGDSILLRIVVFVVLGGLFLLVVQLTHKQQHSVDQPVENSSDSIAPKPMTK